MIGCLAVGLGKKTLTFVHALSLARLHSDQCQCPTREQCGVFLSRPTARQPICTSDSPWLRQSCGRRSVGLQRGRKCCNVNQTCSRCTFLQIVHFSQVQDVNAVLIPPQEECTCCRL